jgi:hypothetical protein
MTKGSGCAGANARRGDRWVEPKKAHLSARGNGSAGRMLGGQNHGLRRCPYAFFRGRDVRETEEITSGRLGKRLLKWAKGLSGVLLDAAIYIH